MDKEQKLAFYGGSRWKACREEYKKSVGYLCEDCLKQGIYKPADAVHHKTFLTADNVNDPSIAYGFDNLVALCADCHAARHKTKRRYKLDDLGRVTIHGAD